MTINHIELVKTRFGTLKPRIIGKRLYVHDIANMIALNGSSIQWVLENFDVTPAQVHAAMAYYYDHQGDIDREIKEEAEYARQHAISSEEHLVEMRSRLPQKSS